MKIYVFLSIITALLLLSIPVFGDDLTKIYGSIPKNGVNHVTLDNSQNNKEAVVVFKEKNWPNPFAVYLKPYETGTLSTLPNESYEVYYMLGNNWNSTMNDFNSNPEYYMLSKYVRPAIDGTIHTEETQSSYFDNGFNNNQLIRKIEEKYDKLNPTQYTWAESTILLSPDTDSISINKSDIPLN
jgi:hypothetical protein